MIVGVAVGRRGRKGKGGRKGGRGREEGGREEGGREGGGGRGREGGKGGRGGSRIFGKYECGKVYVREAHKVFCPLYCLLKTLYARS